MCVRVHMGSPVMDIRDSLSAWSQQGDSRCDLSWITASERVCRYGRYGAIITHTPSPHPRLRSSIKAGGWVVYLGIVSGHPVAIMCGTPEV